MKNIVLTSCGIIDEDIKCEFYNIVNREELSNKKVLYITTAADGDVFPFTQSQPVENRNLRHVMA